MIQDAYKVKSTLGKYNHEFNIIRILVEAKTLTIKMYDKTVA